MGRPSIKSQLDTAAQEMERPFASLSDAELAAMMGGSTDDVKLLIEWGCPQNPDDTWDYLTVCAWVENDLREHFTGRKAG